MVHAALMSRFERFCHFFDPASDVPSGFCRQSQRYIQMQQPNNRRTYCVLRLWNVFMNEDFNLVGFELVCEGDMLQITRDVKEQWRWLENMLDR